MYEEKLKENKSRAVAKSVVQKKRDVKQGYGFVDNRPETIAQRNMHKMLDACTIQQKVPFQKKENTTSIQNNHKSGLESTTVQMVTWPSKKKNQPNVSATLWEDEDTATVKELYEWCTTVDQFEKIIAAMTKTAWVDHKDFVTEHLRETFDSELDSSEGFQIASLFAYYKGKGAVQRVLQVYDASTYVFPSLKATQMMTAAGVGPADYTRSGLIPSIGRVHLADANHEKLRWEKETNNAALTMVERVNKNQEKNAALEVLGIEVGGLASDKTTLDQEEAAIALYNANVAQMVVLANTIPSFAAVTGNPLANAIWTTSVNNAGKTGYLQDSDTIHTKATLIAATALLHTFSKAWTLKYPNGMQYLSNPHTPGGGNPQNKTGHSNPELRPSINQADFITGWDGKKTVVHISSDSL